MPPTDAEALKAMTAVADTATSLLQQLGTVLGNIHKGRGAPSTDTKASEPIPSNIDALALARDSTSLIRAHSTKLSLLIINEPFTPSAISTVVRELVTGPIPGLASSLEVCDAKIYTSVLRCELAWRAQRVFIELGALIQKIPKDGKVLSSKNQRSINAAGKGSLVLTGLLWSACDDVTTLANMGVGGFFVKKAEQWRDTLKDVMEELKEWGEEEPDDDDDEVDDLADQLGDTHLSKQEMLDDLMNSSEAIPRDDPDGIRPRLESALKRLRLVVLLYQAMSKRRFKKLPMFPPKDDDLPKKLDDTATSLEQLPDKFGDLAAAFYSLDAQEIDETATLVFADAVAASKLLSTTWDGKRDEFTEWTDKFESELKKT